MPGSLDRNRVPWVVLATVLMFASAICALFYLDAVGKISGWIGVPEYEAYVPHLQRRAGLWSGLAVLLPFVAALLLGLGKRAEPGHAGTNRTRIIGDPKVSHEWSAVTAILTYLLRLAVSALGSLAFVVAFVLVVSLLEKLGMRAH